ncbi:MAG: hypothetical protein U0174_24620 [Polyangiaceae bacterium]
MPGTQKPTSETPLFQTCMLGDLDIGDEKSFRHVGLYADLKRVLERANYTFRVLPERDRGRWDKALLLNLTFWGATGGGDVLTTHDIEADVVAHVAWHHLAARALGTPNAPLSVHALFLGESIASAFDVYLVGRLLGHAPKSSFLESQVPAMADAVEASGYPEKAFDDLLQSIASDPDRAFEDLRALLFDVSLRLFSCANAEEGLGVLSAFESHSYAMLLPRYELSNWVLYARAYGAADERGAEMARAVDRALRSAPVALDWLEAQWVTPALTQQ